MGDLISRKAVQGIFCANCIITKFGKLCDRTCRDIERIKAVPAVDAVPVVRCKDCKHYDKRYNHGVCTAIEYIMDGYYRGTFEEKRPDDFCSYGVRKDGEIDE